MYETRSNRLALRDLLDRSYRAAGEHLRSIFTPERRMAAEELAQLLTGAFLLNVATVTAAGHPMVAPVDGLFHRGKLLFGFPPGSVRGARSPSHVSTEAAGSELG